MYPQKHLKKLLMQADAAELPNRASVAQEKLQWDRNTAGSINKQAKLQVSKSC